MTIFTWFPFPWLFLPSRPIQSQLATAGPFHLCCYIFAKAPTASLAKQFQVIRWHVLRYVYALKVNRSVGGFILNYGHAINRNIQLNLHTVLVNCLLRLLLLPLHFFPAATKDFNQLDNSRIRTSSSYCCPSPPPRFPLAGQEIEHSTLTTPAGQVNALYCAPVLLHFRSQNVPRCRHHLSPVC